MDQFSFSELLSYQLGNAKILNYKNELAAMLDLHSDGNVALRRRMSRAWLSALIDKNKSNANFVEDAIQHAIRLREEGNTLYSSKVGTKYTNLMKAGQRYTQAIFTAPENTEALALSYANRATVLQELEYYQQAYDDCCCALESNKYPQRLLHKIKTRQAFCALYLKDTQKLADHVEELECSNLNENFARRLQELREGLKTLANEENTKENKIIEKQMPMEQAVAVVDTKDAIRGRYMIATKPIKSGEVIFGETANAFVPVAGSQMCQQCGVILMIPLPCHGCNGRVIYCSLKCRKANLNVHQNECTGHQCGLFEKIGISFLALRVVLEELPKVLSIVGSKIDVEKCWLDLTTLTELHQTQNNVNYIKTLRMVTHLSKMSSEDITYFALVADFLLVYLKDYTNFFSINHTAGKQIDLELITSALILRHIGQFIVNAHTRVSLTPTCYDISSPANVFGILLLPDLWTKPFHLCRGMLHVFSECSEVSAVNLPYLSICNHACAPTLLHKYSGRNFTAFADRDVEHGAEIFNCYTTNYRNSLRDVRRNYLKSIYHFECGCVQCEREDSDADYLKHHIYKCENKKCQKEFVPSVDDKQSLIWWHTEDESDVSLKTVSCPHCTKKQDFKWHRTFKELIKYTNSSGKRMELWRTFEMAKQVLMGSHSLKITMGRELVSAFIDSYMAGCECTNVELNKILEILKFCLKGTADQFSLHSIEYVTVMTFLWDFIALDIYKPTELEKDNMLKPLNIVSDEYRIVFFNYYKDFIDPLF